MQCSAVQCYTAHWSAVQCSAFQCSAYMCLFSHDTQSTVIFYVLIYLNKYSAVGIDGIFSRGGGVSVLLYAHLARFSGLPCIKNI